MKNLFKTTGLATIIVSIIFFLASCGGGTSTNESLGKLPGMAKKYTEKIDKMKKDLKECTDMQKAFKLDEKIKTFKDESTKAFEEQLANNPLNALPYEQKADYPFTITEVIVNTEYSSSYSYLHLIAKVKINEDIKNQYGGFERTIFAYVIAVDKEGNSLSKKPDVFSSGFGKQEFKKGMDFELKGGIKNLENLENFEKLIFVSKDYKNPNK